MNVLITGRLPDTVLADIEATCKVVQNRADRPMPREAILQQIEGQDGLLCMITDTVDPELLDRAPGLKIIANYGVGFNNIDVAAATRRGILVTNTPDVLTDATADITFALILARRATGFNMTLLYSSRQRLPVDTESALNATHVNLETLLARSDFVSLHVPLTEQTHHLMDAAALNRMRPEAFLINTSRGPVVDETALCSALQNRTIAGAGLDVYEHEPAVTSGLLALDNVVLLPHAGSATIETRTKMARMAADNLLAGLADQKPPNCLNWDTLYAKC